LDEASRLQDLEVLGRVRQAHARRAGERIHGALALAQQLEQLDALR